MESRKTYGTRRIKKKLAAEEIVWSRKRIRRIMAEQGLVAKARCKTRATTDSNHNHPVAPNCADYFTDNRVDTSDSRNYRYVVSGSYFPVRSGISIELHLCISFPACFLHAI